MQAPRMLTIVVAAAVGAAIVLPRTTPVADGPPERTPVVLAAAAGSFGTVTVRDGANNTYSFPIRSLSSGLEQTSDPYGGGGGGAGVSQFSHISVVKTFNAHTPRLQQWAASGTQLKRVAIALSVGGSYVLTDVLVSQVKSNGAGTATPTDRVDFNFRTIRVAKGGVVFCWNRSLNAAC